MAKSVSSIANNNWRVTQVNWSIKTMLNYNKRSQLDYFSHLQRGIVWDDVYRSHFINSILWGMPSMTMPIFSKHGNRYMCIDGKQRSLCVFDFVQDKFALKDVADKPVYSEETGDFVNVNGKKFSQLDQSMKDRIMDFQFGIAIIEGTNGYEVTSETEAEFFRRANSGKQVSKADIAMSVAKCMDAVLDIIGDVEYTDKGKPITTSNFFADCYGINKFKAGTIPKEIVLKSFYLLHPDRLDSNNGKSAAFISIAKLSSISKNAVITEEEQQELKDIFKFIWNARKAVSLAKNKPAARFGTGKNILLAYIPFVHRFKDVEQLGEWFIYENEKQSDELKDLTWTATATKTRAENRFDYIQDSIEKFLENYNDIIKEHDFGVKKSVNDADEESEDDE